MQFLDDDIRSDFRLMLRDAKELAQLVHLIQNEPLGTSKACSGLDAGILFSTNYSLGDIGDGTAEITRIGKVYTNKYNGSMSSIVGTYRRDEKSISFRGCNSVVGFEGKARIFRKPKDPKEYVMYETLYERMHSESIDVRLHPYSTVPVITEESLFQLSTTYTREELESYVYGWVFDKYQLKSFTLHDIKSDVFIQAQVNIFLHFDKYKGYHYNDPM